MKKLSLLSIIYIMLNSCQKEIGNATYIKGNTINIDGFDTTIYYNGNTDIEYYNSGNSSELVTEIPFCHGCTISDDGTVIYSVLIPNLKAGDIILATAKAEVTTTISNEFLLKSGLKLADAQTAPEGTELTEENGSNLYPAILHGIITKSGTYECETDLGNKYVNLAVIAEDFNGNNGSIRVEQDYGRLSVMVFRK